MDQLMVEWSLFSPCIRTGHDHFHTISISYFAQQLCYTIRPVDNGN